MLSSLESEHSNIVNGTRLSTEDLGSSVSSLKEKLDSNFKKNWKRVSSSSIWSIGNNNPPSLLINATDDYERSIFCTVNSDDERYSFDQIVVETFQKFVNSGPVCMEPVANCAVFVTEFRVNSSDAASAISPTERNECIKSLMASFHVAFRSCVMNIMEPILKANVETGIVDFGKSSLYYLLTKLFEIIGWRKIKNLFHINVCCIYRLT